MNLQRRLPVDLVALIGGLLLSGYQKELPRPPTRAD
jgi:hypothetical protein